MVSYLQPFDQQESDYLDRGPLSELSLPRLSLTLLDKALWVNNLLPQLRTGIKRFNIILTDRNLFTFPLTSAWTLPHESRMGGIEVGQGLAVAALTGDRGHACGERRLWGPGGGGGGG